MIKITVQTFMDRSEYFEEDSDRLEELNDYLDKKELFTILDGTAGVVLVNPSNCATVSISEVD